MTETYFPTEIFNLIKDYANIDPIKRNQKKYMKLLERQIRHEKWGSSGFEIEEARRVKSKIHRWGIKYLFGREERNENHIVFLTNFYEAEGMVVKLETGVYRNMAWNFEYDGEYEDYYDYDAELNFTRFLNQQQSEYLEYLENEKTLPKRCLIKI